MVGRRLCEYFGKRISSMWILLKYIKINFGNREKVKHAVRMRYIWFCLKLLVMSRVILISCHCELEA